MEDRWAGRSGEEDKTKSERSCCVELVISHEICVEERKKGMATIGERESTEPMRLPTSTAWMCGGSGVSGSK